MAESIEYRKRARGKKGMGTPFYGAVKSHNEVYFQMASLFQEVTRGKMDLSGKWMDRILKTNASNRPGNTFIDNI